MHIFKFSASSIITSCWAITTGYHSRIIDFGIPVARVEWCQTYKNNTVTDKLKDSETKEALFLSDTKRFLFPIIHCMKGSQKIFE